MTSVFLRHLLLKSRSPWEKIFLTSTLRHIFNIGNSSYHSLMFLYDCLCVCFCSVLLLCFFILVLNEGKHIILQIFIWISLEVHTDSVFHMFMVCLCFCFSICGENRSGFNRRFYSFSVSFSPATYYFYCILEI